MRQRFVVSAYLRALDFLPEKGALWLGIAGGLLGGGIAAGLLPWPIAAVGFVLALAIAAFLAFSGEPVAEEIATVAKPRDPAAEKKPTLPLIPGTETVTIPAGVFLMGSPEDEPDRESDESLHEVSVSSFLCMRVPVTRELYLRVMGSDPGWPEGDADLRPVNLVSWYDAVEFCNRLSDADRLQRCYERVDDVVTWIREADGWRLPTEAEWEYACRAGTQSLWSFGDDEKLLADNAWFAENSGGQPRQVELRRGNPWGLRDMHGNVFEWCWDQYGPYDVDKTTDPEGPSDGGSRVLRGGAFNLGPRYLRSAFRVRLEPGVRGEVIGFRCVRGPRRRL